MLDTDLDGSKNYIPAANSHFMFSGSSCKKESQDEPEIKYSSNKTLWRVIGFTEAGLMDVGNDYKDFYMTKSDDNKQQCEEDDDNWGYDCYPETNSKYPWSHIKVIMKIDGSASNSERTMCLLLLLVEGDGAATCSPVTIADQLANSYTYTIGASTY